MNQRQLMSFIGAIVSVVVLLLFFGPYVGFINVWTYITNFTPFIPFIITGAICLVLGIRVGKYGSMIFGIVVLALFANSCI